jgi:uncharacterized membrane protein (DUF485 family)
MRTVSAIFWLLVLAVVVMFAFFVALGAYSPGNVVALTIVVAVLAVAWVVHSVWVARHTTGRDPASVRARERRGF